MFVGCHFKARVLWKLTEPAVIIRSCPRLSDWPRWPTRILLSPEQFALIEVKSLTCSALCSTLRSALGFLQDGWGKEGSAVLKIERSTLCIVSVKAADASGLIVRWSWLMSQSKIIISIQRLWGGICLVLLHSDSKLTECNISRI